MGMIWPSGFQSYWVKVHQICFALRENCCRSGTCLIWNIDIRSKNICRQILQSFEMTPSFAHTCPNFFRGRPLKFWTVIIKSNRLPIVVKKILQRSPDGLGDLETRKKTNTSKICLLRKLSFLGRLIIHIWWWWYEALQWPHQHIPH